MAKKKTVIDEEKVNEAKKKVNELLKGTGLEEPEESVLIDPMSYKAPVGADQFNQNQTVGANEWLQQQVEALTRQIGEMEAVIVRQQNELVARGGGNGAADNEKIIELFKHFENIYMGKSMSGRRYGQVAFSYPQDGTGVLDVLLRAFPFLNQYREYSHWG